MKPHRTKQQDIAEQFGDWYDERTQLDHELDLFEQWRFELGVDRDLSYDVCLSEIWPNVNCAGCGRGNPNAKFFPWCDSCTYQFRAFEFEAWQQDQQAEKERADQVEAWLSGRTSAPSWATEVSR